MDNTPKTRQEKKGNKKDKENHAVYNQKTIRIQEQLRINTNNKKNKKK
jgi:hypothetical protein